MNQELSLPGKFYRRRRHSAFTPSLNIIDSFTSFLNNRPARNNQHLIALDGHSEKFLYHQSLIGLTASVPRTVFTGLSNSLKERSPSDVGSSETKG